jgi:ubiquinone biosynthesis protein UbiJ
MNSEEELRRTLGALAGESTLQAARRLLQALHESFQTNLGWREAADKILKGMGLEWPGTAPYEKAVIEHHAELKTRIAKLEEEVRKLSGDTNEP